jgi:hypothetical protein
MSWSVREALALRASERSRRTFSVVNVQCNSMIVAEIEFGKIAMQMAFVAMLINAFHAAFEDAVEALKRVGVNLATTIFAGAMIDVFVAHKILVQMRVLASFIGHNSGFFRDVGAKDWNQMSS